MSSSESLFRLPKSSTHRGSRTHGWTSGASRVKGLAGWLGGWNRGNEGTRLKKRRESDRLLRISKRHRQRQQLDSSCKLLLRRCRDCWERIECSNSNFSLSFLPSVRPLFFLPQLRGAEPAPRTFLRGPRLPLPFLLKSAVDAAERSGSGRRNLSSASPF